jgi:hypothetical protein
VGHLFGGASVREVVVCILLSMSGPTHLRQTEGKESQLPFLAYTHISPIHTHLFLKNMRVKEKKVKNKMKECHCSFIVELDKIRKYRES